MRASSHRAAAIGRRFTAWRKAPGRMPVCWRKNSPTFVALEKPGLAASWDADMSVWAGMRLAAKLTRRATKTFAMSPAAVWVARVNVPLEWPSCRA
jgi:hypothetical protein